MASEALVASNKKQHAVAELETVLDHNRMEMAGHGVSERDGGLKEVRNDVPGRTRQDPAQIRGRADRCADEAFELIFEAAGANLERAFAEPLEEMATWTPVGQLAPSVRE